MKLLYGVGVNDADYNVHKTEGGKTVWRCPIYSCWTNMLKRCYCEAYQKKRQTYIGCTVASDWHLFSNFRAWVITQDWQDKTLDKDLLVEGNTIYSPEACCFISARINSFLVERKASRGEWPIGVVYHKGDKKYQAQCGDIVTGRGKYLGSYNTPEEAHRAWLKFKLEQAYILADMQTDKRVSEALIERYTNYNK